MNDELDRLRDSGVLALYGGCMALSQELEKRLIKYIILSMDWNAEEGRERILAFNTYTLGQLIQETIKLRLYGDSQDELQLIEDLKAHKLERDFLAHQYFRVARFLGEVELLDGMLQYFKSLGEFLNKFSDYYEPKVERRQKEYKELFEKMNLSDDNLRAIAQYDYFNIVRSQREQKKTRAMEQMKQYKSGGKNEDA